MMMNHHQLIERREGRWLPSWSICDEGGWLGGVTILTFKGRRDLEKIYIC
jgi:hypothetical protein